MARTKTGSKAASKVWVGELPKTALLLACASPLGVISATTPAMAQAAGAGSETDATVADIIVTARRHAESLQNVPVAITALSNEALRTQNIQGFADIQRVAPGFTSSSSTRGGYNPSYSIRGQRGPFAQTILLDSAVAVYFAEMSLARTTGTTQSLFDLESVQVLKGPQGTLFGKNSTGGAVLIEPKKPVFDLEGYGQVSAGNYDFRDFEGVLNVPLGDKVAIRLGGKTSTRDGYLHSAAGQDLNDLDTVSLRGSIRLRPTDAIDSTFIGTYFLGKGAGTGQRIYAVKTLPSLAATEGVLLANDLAAAQAGGKYFTPWTVPQSVRSETYTIQNNTTIDFGASAIGNLSLKNIIGYKHISDRQDGLGNSGSSVQVYTLSNTGIHANQFSEEIQLQGETEKLNYIVGAYYFREKGNDHFTATINGYQSTPAFVALNGRPGVTLQSTSDVDGINTSYAAFVHANYKLSALVDGLSISGGVRITHDKREVTWHNQLGIGVTPAAYLCTVVPSVRPTPSLDRNACSLTATPIAKSVLTYDLGLDYRLSRNVLLYIVTRRGYRSGGFNSVPPIAGSMVGQSFGPEYNRDVELGTKTDFRVAGAPVRVNAAAYYQWYSNIQRTVTQQAGIGGYVVNAAKAHIYGGEVDVSLNPAPGLDLSASASIFKAKYDQWFDNESFGGVLYPVDISDSAFAQVPYRQFSLRASYTLPVAEALGVPTISATWSGQSSMAAIDPETSNCGPHGAYFACNNYLARLPAYSVVNLRADWRNFKNSGLDIAIFVNNVTNKYYYTGGVDSIGQGLGFASATVGEPRMYGMQLRYSFGMTR